MIGKFDQDLNKVCEFTGEEDFDKIWTNYDSDKDVLKMRFRERESGSIKAAGERESIFSHEVDINKGSYFIGFKYIKDHQFVRNVDYKFTKVEYKKNKKG